MRRWLPVVLALALSLSVTPAISAEVAPRAGGVTRGETDLDAGWRFVRADVPGAEQPGYADSSWTRTSVPHTWNALDGQDGGGNYYRGAGWYRKHVTPAKALAGKRLWLQFDGVNTVADVWVNGVHLGQHRGGYATFRFDATDALKPGRDNVIAVRVDNSAQADVAPLSADYTFFGGIYRDVSLVAVDPLAVRLDDFGGPGFYLTQRSVTAEQALVDVVTKVRNSSGAPRDVRVRTTVADARGRVVTRTMSEPQRITGDLDVAQQLAITDPHRWQGTADPYLYRASVDVLDARTGRVTDTVSQPLGLRTSTVDANQGFFLNGQHLALHGVNAHQDRLDEGWAVADRQRDQDFDLMDEMGVNALRTAHYQQSQHVYDLADQRGYVVWAEIPLVNGITDSAAFRANATQQMSELIRQNFNHPSIAFWGIGNEQAKNDAVTNGILQDLADQVKAEDPARLSVYANHKGGQDAVSGHADLAAYNKYYGWYDLSAPGPGPWTDQLHAADPARKIAISEYGAGGSVFDHVENSTVKPPVIPSRVHPEEYETFVHENSWKQIETRPYLWGTFVWNMFDFASDGRTEGDTLGRNDKGLVTYDRQTRKDAFYWYKANWTTTPFVYLTSRRWTSRTEAATTVKAYGNGVDTVSLTLNGTPVGAPAASPDHIYTWPVTLAPGKNVVKVSGVKGGHAYTDTVTWTLTP
ncbi:glycoside hydrolase family 2 TIM barrel-domain containing protein [Amycolatopsis rhabdoformis]|uniref:Glycoside hydrolase family 2 TIM barrel-domain containing protein n=1 Tax=Amycolatopsis rhabdoformis TaxID=1448059 RepID=A0ABZ1HWM3_9PSEU|nr:glycoside hydrolase family 2 TIM barrel-domain containing protein [Amycolatopsis rhabdoformis]WSE26566.1 glycoside hydrolase family 2 TIM barrel-domain containing protein [Amycolatopsis rhabdoformis]